METVSARLALAGRLYLLALIFAVTLVVVVSVERRAYDLGIAARDTAQAQLPAITRAARAAVDLRSALNAALIERAGGYSALPPVLRDLAGHVIRARGLLARPGAAAGERGARLAALFDYNLSPMGPMLEDEPSLPLAEGAMGRLAAPDTFDALTLEEAAIYLWLVTLEPERVGPGLGQVRADPFGPKARTRRHIASVGWETMQRIANDPAAYGLTIDARGQVTLAQVLLGFEATRAAAARTGGMDNLRAAEVAPFGLGVPVPLGIALGAAAYAVAALLAMAAVLWGLAGAAVRAAPVDPETLSLPLPALLAPSEDAGPIMIAAQGALVIAPVLLVGWAVLRTDEPVLPLLAPALAALALSASIRRMQGAGRAPEP